MKITRRLTSTLYLFCRTVTLQLNKTRITFLWAFQTETSSDLNIYWLHSNHDCYKVPITRLDDVYTINSSYTPGMKFCLYVRRKFVFKRIISEARIQKNKMPKDSYSVKAFGLVIFLVPSNSLPLDILSFLCFFTIIFTLIGILVLYLWYLNIFELLLLL